MILRVFSAVLIAAGLVTQAQAGFVCNGPLTQAQIEGFRAFFDPKFSPSLTHQGGAISPANMSKELSAEELNTLNVDQPIVAVETVLNATTAGHLKRYLNENASSEIPGWLATALSIYPQAWVGLAADVMIQTINSSGSEGRLKLANIAGVVSSGGKAAVVHRVAAGQNGNLYYLWNYVFTANLNGKNLLFHLTACSADVVAN